MGTICAGDKVEPKENGDVKVIQDGSDTDSGNSWTSSPRSMTDCFFLLLLAVFVLVVACSVVHCILYGDTFRIINGYDNCGNICGKNRGSINRNNTANCTDSNEDRPFHLVIKRNNTKIKDRYCVKDCPDGYRKFLNRCVPNKASKIVNKFFAKSGISNFFQEVSEDFHLCYKEIIYLCLLSLVLSVLLLVAFRYLVGYAVWFILIGVIIACFVATTWLWILWRQTKNSHDNIHIDLLPDIDYRKRDTYLGFAIVSSVLTAIVVLLIFVIRKRIQIVVELFKESGKALADMTFLIIVPIVTFIYLAAIISLWFYFTLWIESSGHLTKKADGVYQYDKDSWMRVTRWLNVFAMLWSAQFLIGCQHMVIAGAVACWYFTRNKSKLNSPISHSLHNLIRYHLGSVALGSLIIAIVQFLRIILTFVQKKLHGREGSCAKCILNFCQCCLYCLEKILKYLTRNAYIEVAMYGHSFCKGGKQAFRLLVANALRVTAINSVGDFTLFLGKVVIVIATVFAGIKLLENKEGLQHMWVPVTLAGLFAYFVAHCFMTVYEMIIDTIFLCFCEDCEKNDGINRPYYMSRGLMTCVENSKKVIELHDHRKQHKSLRTEVSPKNDSDSQEKLDGKSADT